MLYLPDKPVGMQKYATSHCTVGIIGNICMYINCKFLFARIQPAQFQNWMNLTLERSGQNTSMEVTFGIIFYFDLLYFCKRQLEKF